MNRFDFSEEFEREHPIVATAGYIGETLLILALGLAVILGLIWLLMWASAGA